MPKATKVKTTDDKKRRAKKDPDAPKRSLSAYMFFCQANRTRVKEENPGIQFGAIGKKLGDEWKDLSEKDKAPYEKKAEADKERYEKEKAAAKDKNE